METSDTEENEVKWEFLLQEEPKSSVIYSSENIILEDLVFKEESDTKEIFNMSHSLIPHKKFFGFLNFGLVSDNIFINLSNPLKEIKYIPLFKIEDEWGLFRQRNPTIKIPDWVVNLKEEIAPMIEHVKDELQNVADCFNLSLESGRRILINVFLLAIKKFKYGNFKWATELNIPSGKKKKTVVLNLSNSNKTIKKTCILQTSGPIDFAYEINQDYVGKFIIEAKVRETDLEHGLAQALCQSLMALYEERGIEFPRYGAVSNGYTWWFFRLGRSLKLSAKIIKLDASNLINENIEIIFKYLISIACFCEIDFSQSYFPISMIGRN